MSENKIKAGVVGATGYAGAELCRILTGHPGAELTAVSSVSFEGKKLSDIYPSYYQVCEPVCGKQEEVVEQCDVILPPCRTACLRSWPLSATRRGRRSLI